MSQVLAVAKALYDQAHYAPHQGWDTADGRARAEFYMNEARTALMVSSPTFGRCRVCRDDTVLVASFGPAVPYPNVLSVDAPRSPLRVQVCESCVLPQLEESVDPTGMFDHYPYRSAQSATFTDHTQALVDRQKLPTDAFVVEIGSNDGTLLRQYRDVKVLGVDPSDTPAVGVPTLRAYFDERVAHHILAKHGPADRIHANNVIAHCPEPHTVFAGIAALLAETGVAIIESPYVAALEYGWDSIYQEHVFYWSATAMDRIARQYGLSVVATEPLAIHGGSMRYYLKRGSHPGPEDLIVAEKALSFAGLNERIIAERNAVAALTLDGVVCGYGAAAKGAIFRHVCDLDLAFVCDSTPNKQGQTMPGTTIPIVGTERLADADVAVLFAWNFADEIMAREANWPGRWIIPHRVSA